MTVAFATTAMSHARADSVMCVRERLGGAFRSYRLAMNRTLIAWAAFVSCLAAACSYASEESKPVEAVNERPVADVKRAEVVNERREAVAAWSARLIQRNHGPEGTDAILLDVSIEDAGGRRPLATNILGPLVVFERERKILSCESTGAMTGARPIVIDLYRWGLIRLATP